MSSRLNPFVQGMPNEISDFSDVSVIIDDSLCVSVLESGPESPDLVNSVVPETPSWPVKAVLNETELAIFGLHGGAGTSTIAKLFGDPAVDVGQGWPVTGNGTELPVIAVARTHYKGLAAAESFTEHWGAGLLPASRLIGLILIDDAPRLTDSQKKAVKRLLAKTPRGAHVPWMEIWRLGPPDQSKIPSQIQRIVRAFKNA